MIIEIQIMIIFGVEGTGWDGNEEKFLEYWVMVPWLYTYVKVHQAYTND